MVKGLVKFETACTMVKKTKYVDASPSERIERRLLPSDHRSLAGRGFRSRPAPGLSRQGAASGAHAELLTPAWVQLVGVAREGFKGAGKLAVLFREFDRVGAGAPAVIGLAQRNSPRCG